MNNNPIGPDYATKKYITRGGRITTLELNEDGFLYSPVTQYEYLMAEKEADGNLVFAPYDQFEDDIVAEVVVRH